MPPPHVRNLLHVKCMDMEWQLLLVQSVTVQHNTGLTLWVKLSMREWWVGGSSSVTDAKWEYGISSNIYLQYYVIGWQLPLYWLCYSHSFNNMHMYTCHSTPPPTAWTEASTLYVNRPINCDVHRPCKMWTEATFRWFHCAYELLSCLNHSHTNDDRQVKPCKHAG